MFPPFVLSHISTPAGLLFISFFSKTNSFLYYLPFHLLCRSFSYLKHHKNTKKRWSLGGVEKYFRWSCRFSAKKKADGIIANLPYNYVDLF